MSTQLSKNNNHQKKSAPIRLIRVVRVAIPIQQNPQKR
jgi:hypothetical protein